MHPTSPLIRYAMYGLWIAHPVLQCIVAGIMLRRKLSRIMPMFFAYIVSQIVIFAFLFPTQLLGSVKSYFYLYWATSAVSAVLGFMVIREIFRDVFRPFPALRDLGSIIFRWAGIVMAGVGLILMVAGSSESHRIMQVVLAMERGVRVMQCGLILFLLLFSTYLGLSWKNHSFGLALGFGTFAVVEMALMVYRARVGYTGDIGISLVNMVAYNMSIAVWMFYLLSDNPARRRTEALLKPVRWNESLADALHPTTREAFLPMFEGIVDRALSRSVAVEEEKPVVEVPVAEPAPVRAAEPRPTFVTRPIAVPSVQHG